MKNPTELSRIVDEKKARSHGALNKEQLPKYVIAKRHVTIVAKSIIISSFQKYNTLKLKSSDIWKYCGASMNCGVVSNTPIMCYRTFRGNHV